MNLNQVDKIRNLRCRSNSDLFALLGIVVLGALIYGNTLNVPWYFDDTSNIVRNPLIRDLGSAWDKLLAPRGLAMFSFALNYHFHGIELPGYHVVNISIHLLTSCFVYLILKRVFTCSTILPLLAATIFLAHPLQTQSVTYVVQRMTSLGGLFFFISMYLYIRGRETLAAGQRFTSLPHLFFYLASLLSGAIAVHTKQNAAVLPICIFLFDYFFQPESRNCEPRPGIYLIPYFVAPLWMALTLFLMPVMDGVDLQAITSTNDPAKGLILPKKSGLEYQLSYLVTEFSVLWLYMRLLFIPYGQVLDYQYPLTTSLLTLKNCAAFLGLAGLLGYAAAVRRKIPSVSFAIAWFFITLSVESTIIPLDPVFEHRLYIPMFGFAVLLPKLFQALGLNRQRIYLLSVTVMVYSVLTWFRNDLWSRECEFLEDQYSKVPHGTRGMITLSKCYLDKGRDQEAEALLNKAIAIDPTLEKAYINLSSIMVRKQRLGEALELLRKGLQSNPYSGELHNNLGVLYDLSGDPELAIEVLLKSNRINPGYAETYTNLGAVYAGLKRWDDAELFYRKGISVLYENPRAHYNLGVALFTLGRMSEAAESFRTALKFAADDPDALFNLANTYIELKNLQSARDLLPRLRVLDSGLADKLANELTGHK